jgi:heme exporter protein D
MSPFFDWLSMGGYSMYVWPAYGLVFGIFVVNFGVVKWQKNRTRQKLQRWFKR